MHCKLIEMFSITENEAAAVYRKHFCKFAMRHPPNSSFLVVRCRTSGFKQSQFLVEYQVGSKSPVA